MKITLSRRKCRLSAVLALIVVVQGCMTVATNIDTREIILGQNYKSSLDAGVINNVKYVDNKIIPAGALALDHLLAGRVAGSGKEFYLINNEIGPFIPWPPPKSTSHYLYSKFIVEKNIGNPIYIFASKIENSLKSIGYDELSYFTAPGGFILTTRLEKIDKYATRQGDVISDAENYETMFKNYFYRLLFNKNGRYRILVFVLTNEIAAESNQEAIYDDARRWTKTGVRSLPEKFATTKITGDHKFYVLIYEFSAKNDQPPKLLEESDIPARKHLSKILFE